MRLARGERISINGSKRGALLATDAIVHLEPDDLYWLATVAIPAILASEPEDVVEVPSDGDGKIEQIAGQLQLPPDDSVSIDRQAIPEKEGTS